MGRSNLLKRMSGHSCRLAGSFIFGRIMSLKRFRHTLTCLL